MKNSKFYYANRSIIKQLNACFAVKYKKNMMNKSVAANRNKIKTSCKFYHNYNDTEAIIKFRLSSYKGILTIKTYYDMEFCDVNIIKREDLLSHIQQPLHLIYSHRLYDEGNGYIDNICAALNKFGVFNVESRYVPTPNPEDFVIRKITGVIDVDDFISKKDIIVTPKGIYNNKYLLLLKEYSGHVRYVTFELSDGTKLLHPFQIEDNHQNAIDSYVVSVKNGSEINIFSKEILWSFGIKLE